MKGLFREEEYEHLVRDLEWFLDSDQIESPREALSYYDTSEYQKKIKSWPNEIKIKWQLDVDHKLRRFAILSQALKDRLETDTSDTIGIIRNKCEDAATLYNRANISEIAEALSTLADVLDIVVPETQADFIIHMIYTSGLSIPVLWYLCKTIAKTEKGRYLKPAIFDPYLRFASSRKYEAEEILSPFALLYNEFDEALEKCLELEPDLKARLCIVGALNVDS